MVKWEYKRLEGSLEKVGWILTHYVDEAGYEVEYTASALDELLASYGNDGWELINVSTVTTTEVQARGERHYPFVRTVREIYIFKRPIEE